MLSQSQFFSNKSNLAYVSGNSVEADLPSCGVGADRAVFAVEDVSTLPIRFVSECSRALNRAVYVHYIVLYVCIT